MLVDVSSDGLLAHINDASLIAKDESSSKGPQTSLIAVSEARKLGSFE